ncbi:hypothetical protein DPMN_117420 [Dreissena polymorpha]|uniref:Uncharacterized protein n=1 Tax=Dreissena polymorpha TaxID=45954 RepID=A0A9D4QV68_DREPO|nr:hypothetical protein DPMN_117420 [Dreissena polymorpha]
MEVKFKHMSQPATREGRQSQDKFLSGRLRQGSASTALPLWPLSLSPARVERTRYRRPGFPPITKEPRVRPVSPSTGGPAVPPYPSLYRRDLWTGTGRRALDDKQRIGQVRCILEKTAVQAVKKTSGSRVTDSAGFAEPSAEDQAARINLLQAAPGLGRDDHAPAADRDTHIEKTIFYNLL